MSVASEEPGCRRNRDLAGAYYGYKAIPQRWTERLLGLEDIRQMSTQLIEALDWQSKEQVEAR